MFNKYTFYQSLFFGVLGVFAVGLFFWMRYESRQNAKMGVLTVGVIQGLPLGSSGDLHDGFNWDLAHFLGLKLHKKIQRKLLWTSDLIKALDNDEVDVVCAPLNITDERLKHMAMIHVFGAPDPYITLLFWDDTYKKELAHAERVRDVLGFFEKHSVGVAIEGSIWDILLKKYGFKNVRIYRQEPHLVTGLKEGEVTAILVGRVSTDFLQRQQSNLWALKIALDKPYSYGIGVALCKDRQKIIKNVADAIKDLKDDGTIAMLQQKWFGKIY